MNTRMNTYKVRVAFEVGPHEWKSAVVAVDAPVMSLAVKLVQNDLRAKYERVRILHTERLCQSLDLKAQSLDK